MRLQVLLLCIKLEIPNRNTKFYVRLLFAFTVYHTFFYGDSYNLITPVFLSGQNTNEYRYNRNLIEKTQIMGGVKAVHCVVSGDVQHFAKNVMLVLGNNTVDVYEAEEGYFPSLLDDSHLLFAPISRIENIACSFKIVII